MWVEAIAPRTACGDGRQLPFVRIYRAELTVVRRRRRLARTAQPRQPGSSGTSCAFALTGSISEGRERPCSSAPAVRSESLRAVATPGIGGVVVDLLGSVRLLVRSVDGVGVDAGLRWRGRSTRALHVPRSAREHGRGGRCLNEHSRALRTGLAAERKGPRGPATGPLARDCGV